MSGKGVKFFLAFLTCLSGLWPVPTQAAVVVVSPMLTYADDSGLNFRAIPAQWSVVGKSQYQWIVNGKIITGSNNLFFKANIKQKTQKIQFQDSRAGEVAVSVVAKISQIIVNKGPVVNLNEGQSNLVTVVPGFVSPKSASVSYQWYKGAIDIVGAKSKTYKPTTGDEGSKIYVNARYASKGFTENVVDSNEVKIPILKRNYQQLWADEFNGLVGSSPDSTIWVSQDGDGSKTAAGGGWGNRERQYYIAQLAKITSAGALQIEATTSGASGYSCYYKAPCEWVSSKYITKGKVEFKYGRLEARIKGPVGAGTWGAFWMLGSDIDKRPWPWCGEIDVTELVGKNPLVNYGYLHGLLSGGFGGRGTTVAMPNGFADEYHNYAIDWLPDHIDWYVDGILFGSQQKIDKDWVFDHEFYLVMNLAMGGNLGGPIESGLSQADMSFDWIRFSSINGIGEVIKR